MRKTSTEAERLNWIRQWESSGQSQTEWCKTKELSLHTFRRWVSNYRKDQEAKEEPHSIFIPLADVMQETVTFSSLELVYPNGVQLRIPAQVPSQQLKAFIHLYDQCK